MNLESTVKPSRIIFGAMGIGGVWDETPLNDTDIREAADAISAALEIGINFFDFANIYRKGKSEEVFGRYLQANPGLRKNLVIQSKASIRPKRYDFSKDHLISEVEGSLKRLKTDYLDVFLLHRPDILMDGRELRITIDELFNRGLIRNLGVSNMSHHQIEHIQHYVQRPIVANQLDMSLNKLDFAHAVVDFNKPDYSRLGCPQGTVEYCERNHVMLQAYGSLAQGLFSGKELNEGTPANVINTKNLVDQMAKERGVSNEGIVLAWLMRHPANIHPVIGTKNPSRIKAVKDAFGLELSREEWYALFMTSGARKTPV